MTRCKHCKKKKVDIHVYNKNYSNKPLKNKRNFSTKTFSSTWSYKLDCFRLNKLIETKAIDRTNVEVYSDSAYTHYSASFINQVNFFTV